MLAGSGAVTYSICFVDEILPCPRANRILFYQTNANVFLACFSLSALTHGELMLCRQGAWGICGAARSGCDS